MIGRNAGAGIGFALLLVGAVLLVVAPAEAQLHAFAGRWTNEDSDTRGVTALDIQVVGTAVTIQACGRCHPADCDWGRVEAHAYARSVSSSLPGTAEALSAVFRTGFSETLLVVHRGPRDRLRGDVLTRFTDGSGRSNYAAVYTFVRGRAARLPAPVQISPADGTVFSHFPRTTTLAWRPVPGARSYTVEVDCFHCCQNNRWCSDLGAAWRVVPDIGTTSYTFNFVGAQPGRWRVWAVDASGRDGEQSDWWGFRYTR